MNFRSLFIQLVALGLPWRARRFLLNFLLGYELHRTSKVGYSLIFSARAVLGPGSRIGHLSFIKGLDLVEVGANSKIGNLNWISAFPTKTSSLHFSDDPDRRAVLIIAVHSAITNRHLIDCTGGVFIGSFTTVAGFRSQILTHSINLKLSRQSAAPVRVGDYCFLGTGCILLSGSSLPDYCVLGAGSMLSKKLTTSLTLYGGVPAMPIKKLDQDSGYFRRLAGYVN